MKQKLFFNSLLISCIFAIVHSGISLCLASDDDIKRAAAFRKSYQYDKALSAVENHLKQSPNDRNALFMEGLILTDLERYNEGIHIFQKLINIYPYTPELYNNLGTVLAFSGQYEESQRAFQKALHLSHSYRAANKNLDTLKFVISYVNDKKKESTNQKIISKKFILSIISKETSQKKNKRNNADTCSKLVESHMLIRQIQTGLSQLGYYTGKIDGTFQSILKSAIEDFQNSYHLKVNGYISWKLLATIQDIVDEKKILTIHKDQMSLSHIHSQRLTQKIQNGLFDLGYYSGPQHGIMNDETLQALNQFIGDNNISEKATISHDISGHVMQALYQIQGKWTVVPQLPSDSCTHFISLIDYIDSGYKPIRYIGYATVLKHKTGHSIMIVNTPSACREMKKMLNPYFMRSKQMKKIIKP